MERTVRRSLKGRGEGPFIPRMMVVPDPDQATVRFTDWHSRAQAVGRAFAPGEVLNGIYEVGELLGVGGMGQVYEAWDHALDRRVAIKVQWPQAPADSLESIRKEAKLLAAVRHPSTVTVHGLGLHRGLEYMVMERVYGVNLFRHVYARYRDRQQMAVEEALDILIGVADGLSAVHRAGLAHNDVKSANIMLAPGKRVVLMDFGVARPDCTEPEGQAGGTLSYMAPETILGSVQRGGGYLADIYAFGALGHELLSGHLPYESRGDEAMMMQHVDAPIPDVRESRPDVPDALAHLLTACLAKHPQDRPGAMDAVTHDLRAIRNELQPVARSERFSVIAVDDDPTILRALRRIIESEIDDAAEVRTANDAEEGVRLVRERPPDVIVCDLEMPRMNGIELCMWLTGTHLSDRCHVVAMSGSARESDRALLLQLGVTRFVEKGPDFSERMTAALLPLRRRR